MEQVVCEQEIVPPSGIVRDQKLAARLRGDLDNIVLHAMQKDPARRYETAEELSRDIRRHLADKPIKARPDTWMYRSRKFARRNRVWLGVAAALIVTFAAGLTSGEIRERLNAQRQKFAQPRASATPAQPALVPKERLELLIELGDSYAGEQKWNEALTAYEQARAQLPSNPTDDNETTSDWRTRIGKGIEQAHQHRGP